MNVSNNKVLRLYTGSLDVSNFVCTSFSDHCISVHISTMCVYIVWHIPAFICTYNFENVDIMYYNIVYYIMRM